MAQNTTLLEDFGKKFFDTQKASNILCSVDFGKSLFKYINHKNPNPIPVPNGSAAILRSVKKMMQTGKFGNVNVDDDFFVRFFINKVNEDPGLVTFEMIADVLKSNAYKSFGSNNAKDKHNKRKFETWIYNKSILSKINDISLVDVVLHKEAMLDVIDHIALKNKKGKNDAIYKKQLNEKEKEFDEIFNKNGNSLTELQDAANAAKKNKKKNKHTDWIKSVYDVLCEPDEAEYINEIVDAVAVGSRPKERNYNLLGMGTATNKVILAVAKRQGWGDKDIQSILVKTNTEYNAEKFNEINEVQNGVKKQGWYQKNAALDVFVTFFSAAGFSTTISALSKITPVVGPLFAGASVVVSGLGSYILSYREAKKAGNLTKQQKRAMAFKAASAMGKKLAPYAVSMAFGGIPGIGGILSRSLGIAHVFVKTLIDDLERRAGVNEQTYKVDKSMSLSDKIKGKLRHLRELKKLSLSDVGNSAAHALFKGLAVGLGSFGGQALGSRLGDLAFGAENPLDIPTEDTMQNEVQQNQTQNETEINAKKYEGLEDQHQIDDAKGQLEVETSQTMQETEQLSYAEQYVKQYMEEHPGADLDKNGWMQNADGSYARNEDGQLFGSDERVFRNLNSNEMLDQYGNIVDKFNVSSSEAPTTGMDDLNSSVPEVKAELISETLKLPEDAVDATFQSQPINHTEMPFDSESLYQTETASYAQLPEDTIESQFGTKYENETQTFSDDVESKPVVNESKPATKTLLPEGASDAAFESQTTHNIGYANHTDDSVASNQSENLNPKLKTILMPGSSSESMFTENGHINYEYDFTNPIKMPENEY